MRREEEAILFLFLDGLRFHRQVGFSGLFGEFFEGVAQHGAGHFGGV
jgi:hypothetical protein